jgi:hypothetical protein
VFPNSLMFVLLEVTGRRSERQLPHSPEETSGFYLVAPQDAWRKASPTQEDLREKPPGVQKLSAKSRWPQ